MFFSIIEAHHHTRPHRTSSSTAPGSCSVATVLTDGAQAADAAGAAAGGSGRAKSFTWCPMG
jgi:hypothetical protein